jgi:type IV pilus assembly protein PilV
MLVNKLRLPRREGGFTLMELLITMLIVTVGLLGLAKLQATAVSETAVARTRALMTFQAESLAGMMRANKSFWSTTAGPFPSFTVTSAGVASDTQMVKNGSTGSCLNVGCSPANLAWEDMYTWAGTFNNGSATSAFPAASATITCVPSSGASCTANPTVPHSYDIVLAWQQKVVAMNRSTAGSPSQTISMVMHVQP